MEYCGAIYQTSNLAAMIITFNDLSQAAPSWVATRNLEKFLPNRLPLKLIINANKLKQGG